MNSIKPVPGVATRGVYFLSSNEMYDFTIAFLNSFRASNPSIPLCFIPYNENTAMIEALKDQYRFTVFSSPGLLQEYDRMSLRLHEKVRGEYRKLAIWEGDFDEFIYIDIDTVVLDDLCFCFTFLEQYDCLTATSNIPEIRKFVWTDGIEECRALDTAQISYAANTGFLVSKKGFMDRSFIKQSLEKAQLIKDYMQLECMEQPFLNYLIVTAGKPYTSLCVLGEFGRDRKVLYEYWGGESVGEIRNGKMYRRTGGQICFIHWAGVWRLKDQMPNKKIWDYFRNMELPGSDSGNDGKLHNAPELPAYLVV